MGRLIAVTSGKGGVGKSSVSVHLASALAGFGKKVLLIDLDAGMRCLDIMLAVSSRLLFDLNDVIKGDKTLEEAVLIPEDRENISLLAAPLKAGIDEKQLKAFLADICDAYDFVLLDFPAGGVDKLYSALPRYAEALVVCNADAVSVRDAATVVQDLAALKLISVRLILNRSSFDSMKKGITANIDEVIDSCGVQLMGVIPQSMDVYIANCSGEPIKKKSRANTAFDRIAKRILGFDISLPNLKKM